MNSRLERTTPEAQGIASADILRFVGVIEQIPEVHSFMLLRHGCVVAEGWWSPYAPERPHMLFSLSKSFTSSAVGLAVAEGLLSVDDLVLSFFPDVVPIEMNEHVRAMRVRHLLSMSTGHDKDTVPDMEKRADGNWIQGFFDVPVVHEPGTHFLYNSGASYMLSAIVQKLTGMRVLDYLEPRLLQPLGIQNATWELSPQGINTGGWGMNIKTEDIACFGQMYLQKGLWCGQRILPEVWVEEATSFHIQNDNVNIEWRQGYGYQFWRCRHNAYRGDGAFGQFCIVMPDQDVVIAITSGVGNMQAVMNAVWDCLLPAMTPVPLPADPAAHKTLTEKLSSLELPPLQGAASSPTATRISGKTFALETNILNIKTVQLDFSESDSVVSLKIGNVENRITCPNGVWQDGTIYVFDVINRIVASGAWTAEETFTAIMRVYETPYVWTLNFCFVEDQLDLTATVNVSFDPEKTHRMVANPI